VSIDGQERERQDKDAEPDEALEGTLKASGLGEAEEISRLKLYHITEIMAWIAALTATINMLVFSLGPPQPGSARELAEVLIPASMAVGLMSLTSSLREGN